MTPEKQAIFTAQMPANVSLIGHLFGRSCLAFSLPKLHTTVSLSTHRGTKDTWKITNTERLSYQSIDHYLKHLQHVKTRLGYEGGFFVQSNNSFPMGLGLSSSSSSFSALTACAVKAIQASEDTIARKYPTPILQCSVHMESNHLSIRSTVRGLLLKIQASQAPHFQIMISSPMLHSKCVISKNASQ